MSTGLALASLPGPAALDLDDLQERHYMPDRQSQNPLQRLLADAMREAGMPLDVRGSKAELSRRSGVEDAIISNVFSRPRYVPDEGVRKALAQALGIHQRDLDTAAAQIKGLRVYTNEPVSEAGDVVRRLDEATQSFLLASDEMSQAELDTVAERIEELTQALKRRAKPE